MFNRWETLTLTELLSFETSQKINQIISHHCKSVQIYLDAFDNQPNTILLNEHSMVIVSQAHSNLFIYSIHPWTKDDLEKLVIDQELAGEFTILLQGPNSELGNLLESFSSIHTRDIGIIPLNNKLWGNLDSNLRRQINKGLPLIKSFVMEEFSEESWKKDLLSYTKFMLVNDVFLREVKYLPLMYPEKPSKNFRRVILETEKARIQGIVTVWGNSTLSADCHWSFHKLTEKDINLTSLLHWKLMGEAISQGISYYNIGFLFQKSHGIGKYKAQWNAEAMRSIVAKIDIQSLSS